MRGFVSVCVLVCACWSYIIDVYVYRLQAFVDSSGRRVRYLVALVGFRRKAFALRASISSGPRISKRGVKRKWAKGKEEMAEEQSW